MVDPTQSYIKVGDSEFEVTGHHYRVGGQNARIASTKPSFLLM
jgi:hypothetical protein